MILADGVGKPDVGREEKLMLADGVGKPDVGREVVTLTEGIGSPDVGRDEVLRLVDGVGKPDVGREEMLIFVEGRGRPDVGREEVVWLMDGIGSAEVGRDEMVVLPVGKGVKPELGAVTDGRRVVEFTDTVVERLTIETDTDELKLGLEVVMPVLIGTGITEMVDETVLNVVGKPCLVAVMVVVPEVT